jgi:aryl-alcohol dehydrogenase-like predicted oxidoreductase
MNTLVEFAGEKIVRLGLGMSRLGSGTFHSDSYVEQRLRVFDELSDHGKVLLDTSPLYGGGFSESRLGEELSKRRTKFVLASKFYPLRNEPKRHVSRRILESLARLKVQQLDLLQLHWTDTRVRLEGTFEVLEDLLASGVIGHLGLSGFSSKEIEELAHSHPGIDFLSNQAEVHLGNLGVLHDWQHARIPWTLAYGCLLQGRFTYSSQQRTKLKDYSERIGASPATVAIATLVASSKKLLPIVRVSNINHLREVLAGVQGGLAGDFVIKDFAREMPQVVYLGAKRIKLAGDTARKPYRSIISATFNRLNLIPSPLALGRRFKSGSAFLPVLVSSTEGNKALIDLMDPLNEVKRYWGWRVARPGRKIPVIVLETDESNSFREGAL